MGIYRDTNTGTLYDIPDEVAAQDPSLIRVEGGPGQPGAAGAPGQRPGGSSGVSTVMELIDQGKTAYDLFEVGDDVYTALTAEKGGSMVGGPPGSPGYQQLEQTGQLSPVPSSPSSTSYPSSFGTTASTLPAGLEPFLADGSITLGSELGTDFAATNYGGAGAGGDLFSSGASGASAGLGSGLATGASAGAYNLGLGNAAATLGPLGIIGGAYAAYNYGKEAQAVADKWQGGDTTNKIEAGIEGALMTNPITAVYAPFVPLINKYVGLKAGKGEAQQKRDMYRNNLKAEPDGAGLTDSNHNYQLSDGRYYNLGSEDLVSLTSESGRGEVLEGVVPDNKAYNINWDTADDGLVGAVNPLAYLLSGGNEETYGQLTGQLYNMFSQSDDPYADVTKMYDDLERERGLGRDKLAELINYYGTQENGLNQNEIDSFISGIDVRTKNQTQSGYQPSQKSQELDQKRQENAQQAQQGQQQNQGRPVPQQPQQPQLAYQPGRNQGRPTPTGAPVSLTSSPHWKQWREGR